MRTRGPYALKPTVLWVSGAPYVQATEVLSSREYAVMMCIWDGLTVKEAADRLRLSPRTVKNYLQNVYDKLAVSGQVQMVRKALEVGLLQVPENAKQVMDKACVEVPG